MKILLTNLNLDTLGGTETWTATVAKELTRLGHEVHLFSAGGYSLLPDYKRLDNNYDLALINHNVCLPAIDGIDIKRRIFTSHGIIPYVEQPIEGADVYISVSEEVQANLEKKGFKSDVIRNPIDTETFVETERNNELKKVLFMSNYQGEARKVIEDATKGLELRVFGADNRVNALDAMKWADLVIGLGRTALEAMSLGRNVIVYDYNGADGFVDEDTILEFRKNNCSGRRYGIKLKAESLRELYKKYNAHSMRNYILKNNDVKQIVQKYLSYY